MTNIWQPQSCQHHDFTFFTIDPPSVPRTPQHLCCIIEYPCDTGHYFEIQTHLGEYKNISSRLNVQTAGWVGTGHLDPHPEAAKRGAAVTLGKCIP